ncbi:biotin transporter BioY, partial [[Clostridium] symbiosum]
FVLGGKLGSASVLAYLVIGLVGVPVFAAGGGPAYLVRPTFGFLLGFAGAAYTTGTLSERLHRHTFLNFLAAAFAGMMVMYLSGMLYFYFISNYVISMPVTWGIVLVNCFLLTVGGDFLLCVLASALAVRLLPILQKIR